LQKSLSSRGSDTCATFPVGCGGEGKGEWVLTILISDAFVSELLITAVSDGTWLSWGVLVLSGVVVRVAV